MSEKTEAREPLMTADEVAARLRFTSQYVRKMAARGKLPSVDLDGHHRFIPREIEEYINRNRRGPMKPAF